MKTEMKKMDLEKNDVVSGDVNAFYRLGGVYRSAVDGGAASFIACRLVILEYLRMFPDTKATGEQITAILESGRQN